MNADWQEEHTFQRKLCLSLTPSSHLEFTSEFGVNSQELQKLYALQGKKKKKRKGRELRMHALLSETSAWLEKTHNPAHWCRFK